VENEVALESARSVFREIAVMTRSHIEIRFANDISNQFWPNATRNMVVD
jgi:hypothetical protein